MEESNAIATALPLYCLDNRQFVGLELTPVWPCPCGFGASSVSPLALRWLIVTCQRLSNSHGVLAMTNI